MAKQTKNRTAPKTKGKENKGSETRRWVLGAVLFTFGLYLLAASVAYLFCWKSDQSFVHWGAMWGGNAEVANPTGRGGAVMAHYMVGEWFGFFGVLIPVVLMLLALRIINFRPPSLDKSVRLTVITMILGSVTLGFLFGTGWGLFGTGAGGAHGIVVADFIRSYIGLLGCGLLLLLGWILLGVYINRRTISMVNKVGKGIFDQGKKVGGTVIDHASVLIPHKDKTEEDEEEDIYDIPNAYFAGEEEEEYVGEPDGIESEPVDPDRVPQEIIREPGIVAGRGEFEITDSRTRDKEDAGPVTVTDIRKTEKTTHDHDLDIVIARGDDEDVREVRQVFELGVDPETAPLQAAGESAYAGAVGEFATETVNDVYRREIYSRPSATVPSGAVTGLEVVGTDGTEYPDRPETGIQTIGPSLSGLEVVSTTGNPVDESPATLSVGGVLESATEEGVRPGGKLEVVVAGHSDTELDDDQIDETLYDPTLELSKYQRPPVDILEDHSIEVTVTEDEIYENKNQIVRTLENFGIKIDKIKATIGPTVTLYEIVPAAGVKISKIKNLEDDIALSLKALGIRIIAPMPGKGTVGIEVPNKDKEIVSMYSVVKTMKFQESNYELPVVLGKTISNETFVIDLAKMPHLLVAGSTGQGKSVGLNAIITSLLYRKHPAELKFVLVDPKRVELSLYGKLENHFLAKMESEEEAILTDTQKVVYTLNALCTEMTERYDLLRAAGVRKISEYNEKFRNRRLNPRKGHRFMPYIVVIIDEFADMIMTAGREVEAPITRLAQLARAVGIHLVIATQRPDVKVITGLIKANFPARIAFRVMSMVDSRTIIDQPGANQLIGRGDLLMSLNGELTRVQCAFIDTPEIERIVDFISNQKGYAGPYELPDFVPEGDNQVKAAEIEKLDPMFEEVARFVVQHQQGSTSAIQRRFSIGYNRAGRITDQLEALGIVGRAEGSKPREVLITDVYSLEHIIDNLEDR